MKVTRFVVLSIGIFAAGCAQPQWNARHTPRYYGLVDTDQALERKLRSDLNSYPDLANTAPHVLISAQNGTVTLSGAVPNEQTRREIDGIVRTAPGVAVVNDQLQPPYTPTGDLGRPPRIYADPGE